MARAKATAFGLTLDEYVLRFLRRGNQAHRNGGQTHVLLDALGERYLVTRHHRNFLCRRHTA